MPTAKLQDAAQAVGKTSLGQATGPSNGVPGALEGS